MIPRSLNKYKRQEIVEEDLEFEEEGEEESYESVMTKINEEIEDQTRMLENNERTYYNYNATETLEDNIEEHIQQSGFSVFDIHVCMYHVNCQNKYPFLQYFLHKNNKTNDNGTFKIPHFQTKGSETVMYLCDTILNVMYTSFFKEDVSYMYKGFLYENNQYYLFFDCSDMKLECHKMNDINDMWLVTIDEIVNQKKVGRVAIENDTTRFFTKHKEFMYITDRKRNVYETPTVVYTHCESRMADFTATFGSLKSTDDSLYYFTDYERAQNTVKNSKDDLGYTVRHAVFLENTKYDDIQDVCVDYDSLYIGNKNNDYLWAVKNHNQQVVLTYHKIERENKMRVSSNNFADIM